MIITGGKYRSRKLISPSEKIVKPTLSKVRESVFNILLSRIDFDNKVFLDLFAGSGIMGFEAISRGFSELVSIDNNFKNVELLKKNAQILGINGKFLKYNSINYLKTEKEIFDVIYVDPPYDTDLVNISLELIYKNNFLAKDGIIVIETKVDKEIDISKYSMLKSVSYGMCKLFFLTHNNE